MNGSNSRIRNAPAVTPSSNLPEIQVFLSRPAYPLGGAVIGTVLIQQRQPHRRENLRSLLESVTVFLGGFCKIDTRWHDCSTYTKIYGKTHPYLQLLHQKFNAGLLDKNEDTVCFWATNGMEALDLPERSDGRRWKKNETNFERGLRDDVHVDNHENDFGIEDDRNSEINDNDAIDPNTLAFTFRVDIPKDLPHSVHATTCRYFYTAYVLVKTATEQKVLKKNFRVLPAAASPNSNDRDTNLARTSARVKFGTCFGLAHSNGLPCHLSMTEIHRPKGQLMVVQNHCLVQQYNRNNDVQTLRVSNASGQPVCILTVIGSQSLCSGSCIHLQWDFPTEHHNRNDSHYIDGWIPCHQVCAGLQGEEFAIYEDGSKKRTQSFLFDTCHEWVEPGVTSRVSKTLWLSSSGDGNDGNTSHFEGGAPPCNLKTDVMDVSTWCRIDITVREQNNNQMSKEGGGYQNLSLQIPCRVQLRNSSNYDDEHDRIEQQVQPLNELFDIGTENIAFPTDDIRSDLKTLSLTMEELVCGEGWYADGQLRNQ